MRRAVPPLVLLAVLAACSTPATVEPNTVIQELPSPTSVPCAADVLASQSNSGQDSDIYWQSSAVEQPSGYCLLHTVTILSRPDTLYVNWPKAGIERSLVQGTLTADRCCFPYFKPEEDTLEYGISPPRTIQTSVFLGFGEVGAAGVLTTHVRGFTTYDGVAVSLDLSVSSSLVPIAGGEAYEYSVHNVGSPISLTWDFVDHPFIAQTLDTGGAGFPLDLAADEFAFGSSQVFDVGNEVATPVLTIVDPSGQALITILSLAFRPAEPFP